MLAACLYAFGTDPSLSNSSVAIADCSLPCQLFLCGKQSPFFQNHWINSTLLRCLEIKRFCTFMKFLVSALPELTRSRSPETPFSKIGYQCHSSVASRGLPAALYTLSNHSLELGFGAVVVVAGVLLWAEVDLVALFGAFSSITRSTLPLVFHKIP
ncbi:hypothetical protein Tco_0469026 [Tanacetum coccineum]